MIKYLPHNKATLTTPYVFYFYANGSRYKATIPTNYKWDGATGTYISGIIGFYKWGIHNNAVLEHDYLYTSNGTISIINTQTHKISTFSYDRKWADMHFKRKLLKHYAKWQVSIIYHIIRMLGWLLRRF
jgi:hypothetical protein